MTHQLCRIAFVGAASKVNQVQQLFGANNMFLVVRPWPVRLTDTCATKGVAKGRSVINVAGTTHLLSSSRRCLNFSCPHTSVTAAPAVPCVQARTLALSLDYASWNLTPLMTCASLVSRRVTVDGQLCARKPPTMKGTLFVGQVRYDGMLPYSA